MQLPDTSRLSANAEVAQNRAQRLRGRRRTLADLAISLLVHASLFFVLIRHMTENLDLAVNAQPGPIEVRLTRPAPPSQAAAAAQARPAVKPPQPVKPPPVARSLPRRAPVIAMPKPVPAQPPLAAAPPEPPLPITPTAPPVPAPVPPPQAQAAEQSDMSTMLNAARERRRAAAELAGRENADGQTEGRGSSGNDIAMANINRSLQAARGKSGTNGVFQVLSTGVRMGQFSFRGWSSDARNQWRQVIDVDAGSNGDVERAIVRRMIVLIRSHFSGDFNWDSRRLGRVVVLSARPGDNDGLEAFLMREFFDERS